MGIQLLLHIHSIIPDSALFVLYILGDTFTPFALLQPTGHP